MALAGRSARRAGAGVRWLAVGIIITLLILLIDASLHSKSLNQGEQLATGQWETQVLPIITTSSAEGRVIASIWANGLSTPGAGIASELQQVATGSAQAYNSIVKLHPPAALDGPAGLLEACLYSRKTAAASLQAGFANVLGASVPGAKVVTPNAAAAVQAIQSAGNDIQVGDQTYSLFMKSLPAHLGLKIPPSSWYSNPAPYQTQTASVFFASLQNAVNPAPVHQVRVYAISSNPSPVSVQGTTQILPDATAITLTIVVADVGNQPENNLTVTAAISPAGRGSSSVRDFVNLSPGQSYSIVGLGPLNPPQGVPVTLTVTVTPPAGSATPVVTQTMVFQMPAPPPPTTTTTTPTTTPGTPTTT
jgi:hypothetical protein